MINIILNLCRETLSDGQTEDGVGAKTREDVSVAGRRWRHRETWAALQDNFLNRGFAKGYLIQFVMEHSGQHL